MSDQKNSGAIRALSLAWKIWLGVGAGLAVVATILGLLKPWSDRTPGLSADLSARTGAQNFVAFAKEHSGEHVDLDLSCTDDDAKATSCLIEQGIGEYQTLLWTFEGRRCFNDSNDPKLPACQGGNAIWIVDNALTGSVVANGPSGAGSLVVKGEFIVEDEGLGGGVFPRNIQNFRLTPVSA